METLQIKLSGPNFYQYLAIVKSCKGRKYDSKSKCWLVPASLDNLKLLVRIPSLQIPMQKRIDDMEINIEREVLKITVDPEDAYKLKESYPFLYNYQCVAAHYAIKKQKYLIADEMGLGKTVQCMPYINEMIRDGKKVIILCPSSIARQWVAEIDRFISLPSANIVGMLKDKRLSYYGNGCKIIVTTYESFRNDIDDIKNMNVDFSKICIIADEASKFKNKETKIYKELRLISPSLGGFIALTGTPIENKLENFFNIVSIIDPTFMSRDEFNRRYCITETIPTGNGTFIERCIGYKNLREFIHKIIHIMIRRTKKDVTELPPIVIENRIVPLTDAQDYMKRKVREYYKLTNNLGCIVILREVADDTHLLNYMTSGILQDMIRHKIVPLDFPKDGNKLDECIDILEEIGDKKVIIFTQFAQMAHRIGDRLRKEGYNTIVLTGDDSLQKRDEEVERFKNSSYQILVATDIFGYGINLQFCDYMINFDIPWNPAKLNQRIGRIHRQGSSNSKTVINLLSEDIDERVYEVISEKQDLFDQVVEGRAIDDEATRKKILQKLV